MQRCRKNNIIEAMVKIYKTAFLAAVLMSGSLYASLADGFKEDLASERPMTRRRAVYSIIHSTLPPVTAINMLSGAVLDDDLLVKRLAVSGIGNFSRFFEEVYTGSFTVAGISTAPVSENLTEDTTAEKQITPADLALEILRDALGDSVAVIRADAVRVFGSLPAGMVKEDILGMLNDSSFIVIKETLHTAAVLKISEASEKIGELLKHKSNIVRRAAVDFAGDMELEEYIKQIKKIAGKDKSANVKKGALKALVKIQPDKSGEILKNFLDDKDVFMSLEAAFLLAKDSDYSGKEAVFSALERENPEIRLAAAKILLYYDDKESREFFELLLNDSDPAVRSFAQKNNRRKK